MVILVVAVGAAIATLPLKAASAIVIGGALAVVVFLRPVAGLAALALAVPFDSLFELPFGGTVLGATEPLIAVLGAGWLAAVLSRRERLVWVPWPLWPVALFLGIIAFEVTLAQSEALAAKELLRWSALFLVALVGSNVLRGRRQVVILLATLLTAGMLESLVGWYQFFFQVGPPAFALGHFLRAYGTFGQPNPFGGYLGMILPLALALVLHGALPRLRRWRLTDEEADGELPRALAAVAVVAAAVIGIAILMSLSRGAWLGVVVAILLLAGLHYRRLLVLLVVCGGLAVSLVLLGQFELLPAAVATRLSEAVSYFRLFDARTVRVTPENWALVERMASWQAAWGMFESAPLFGVGWGHYVVAYGSYGLKEWPQALGHAHNYYLNVLAEGGALGLAGYALALGGWFAGGIAGLRKLGRDAGRPTDLLRRAAVAGVLGALAAATVHNLFDNLYVHGMNVHVALLLSIMLARESECFGKPTAGKGVYCHQRPC